MAGLRFEANLAELLALRLGRRARNLRREVFKLSDLDFHAPALASTQDNGLRVLANRRLRDVARQLARVLDGMAAKGKDEVALLQARGVRGSAFIDAGDE